MVSTGAPSDTLPPAPRCQARRRGSAPPRAEGHPHRVMRVVPGHRIVDAMLLRPLRRTPMMLGGVGFQAGLDEARRERRAAQQQQQQGAPPAAVEQLRSLAALRDAGTLTPEEFELA